MRIISAIVPLLLLLSLVCCSDLHREEIPDNDALMAHILRVAEKSKGEHQELLKFNAKRPEDLPVAEPVSEEEEEEGKGDDVETAAVVQERMKQLEAMLSGMTNQVVDSHDEMGTENIVQAGLDLSEGGHGPDIIALLNKYAQKLHEQVHGDGVVDEVPVDEHSHGEDLQGHEAIHEHEESNHGHYHHHDHHQDDHKSPNVGSDSPSDAHHHEHDHSGCSHSHGNQETERKKKFRLPEEIAEEEDLLHFGFEGQQYSRADQTKLFGTQDLGIWLRAMGCSLLVSLASLICLMILPFVVSKGKPSESIVNALAAFGAGAMLGDAFLHQLPHAFGSSGSQLHSHDTHQHHDHGHSHSHSHGHEQSPSEGHGHAHSLQDLSIGLAVLGGIILFFVVEKIVRRYEELSTHGAISALGHSHHHHKRKMDVPKEVENSEKISKVGDADVVDDKEVKPLESESSDIKKRSKGGKKTVKAAADDIVSTTTIQPHQQASGGIVIGYLNLFSDAVHNFTDGMALGSAFLLHGSVGGWSRTLFLLAHEIPQEVGDFGILVKSGFSVFEALAFNFLSALVALAGTALALVLGGSLGHSSLIEGFIAGGFIYMSVGGVIPSMHDQGSSLSSTLPQLVPMILGMGVAVVISLSE